MTAGHMFHGSHSYTDTTGGRKNHPLPPHSSQTNKQTNATDKQTRVSFVSQVTQSYSQVTRKKTERHQTNSCCNSNKHIQTNCIFDKYIFGEITQLKPHKDFGKMRPQIKLPLTRKVENMCAPKTTAKKSAKAPKTPPPRDFFTPDIITNALK